MLLAFLTISLASKAVPFEREDCSRYHNYEQRVQFYRNSPDENTCWLSIIPDNERLYMRTYLLDQTGMFMVFNSYGEGPISTHTGARVFYFFPRGRIPHGEVLNSQEIQIQTAVPGLDLIMNSTDGKWSNNQPQGRIIESSRISRNNSGGVEFRGLPALVLDSGFEMGRDPRASDQESKFIDPRQKTCLVANSEIYIYGNNGSIDLRFQDDKTLLRYLKRRCRHLNLNMF